MVKAGHESLTPPVACAVVTCGSSEVPIVAHHFNTPYNKRPVYQSAHKLYNTATFIVQKTVACNNLRLDDASSNRPDLRPSLSLSLHLFFIADRNERTVLEHKAFTDKLNHNPLKQMQDYGTWVMTSSRYSYQEFREPDKKYLSFCSFKCPKIKGEK